MSPQVTAALIAGGVSLAVMLGTVFLTPAFRWAVERNLHRKQAEYAEDLERLKDEHQRELEHLRQEHTRTLLHLELETRKEIAKETSAAEWELARGRADLDYELEQRKELRRQVGSFRGRLIEVGSALNFRIDNLRDNRREIKGDESSEAWLDVDGKYRREEGKGYYFQSTIYRFMAFAAVCNRFERAAVYVDPRYGEPDDELVVFYVRALRWVLTDPKLFEGVHPPYQQQDATDHFFTDDIRRMCAEVTDSDGELKEMHHVSLHPSGELKPVLDYFDGLTAGSLKWDRLMAFGLVLKAFLNTIGYERMKSTQIWFDKSAASIHRAEVRTNLRDWLGRLAIDADEASNNLRLALETADAHTPVSREPVDPAIDGAEPQA